MDVQQLKIFVDVFRARSFAKVADARDIDPSLISRSIASLEMELGVSLFYRTTRKITPTEAGTVFYSGIERLTGDLEVAISSAQNLRLTPSGVLRITAPVSFGVQYLPKIVKEFRESYPDIEVDLVITDSIVDIVEQRIDLAFRFGHLPDSSFVAKKLVDLNYVVCASPEFLREHGKPKSFQELSKLSSVQFLISGFNDGWKFRAKKDDVQIVMPKKGIRASNALVLRELVMSGAGVGLLPRILVLQDLEKKSLIDLFPSFEVTATDFGAKIWILYPSKDHLPEKTRLFIDFAHKKMSQFK